MRARHHQVVLDSGILDDVEDALAPAVPLDVDRLAGERAGCEVTVDRLRHRRALEPDVEDLGRDPLAEMAGDNGPSRDARDLRVDRVPRGDQPGHALER